MQINDGECDDLQEGKITNRKVFVGIKKISCDTVIENSIAITYMTQTFVYPKIDEYGRELGPSEVTYKFPKDPESTVAKLELTIANKTIDCHVMELEKA